MTDILEMKLTIDPGVRETGVGDETVILHLKNGTYYGLDSVGTRIWALLKEGQAPAEVCVQIASEYDTKLSVIQSDARKFLTDALEQGLVVDD